ncbi:hypothetical protein ACFQJ7_08820 [Halovenus rubra]|uniref:Uncharacterized protein n=2 Tax=Halovenus rubra TaxID=869890 RepID=A0ABD5X4S5_9EURY|nr:hypothetical protein [Halovenus rubra]
MGLFETVKQLLGVQAEAAATGEADAEDLFGMSTAYLTMDADLGYEPTGEAALCFSDVDSTGFRDTVQDVREILATTEEDGTVADFQEDDHGTQWIVVTADDFEDLVTNVHFGADTLIEGRYGSRLLAALFAFEGTERAGDPGQRVYWVYSFRRGAYYPFAPTGTNTRTDRVELKLSSVLDGELDVEDDRGYWYPLWPSKATASPWE